MSKTSDVIILNSINITSLVKAHRALQRGLQEVQNELERDGVIQRFECTYEQVWKTLQKVLAFKGIVANNPRDVFRQAAKQEIIDDPLVWFEFITKRNLTTHTYEERTAQEIFEELPEFDLYVAKLIDKLLTMK